MIYGSCSQDSLSDQLNAPTTCGTFSARFGHSDSWWDSFSGIVFSSSRISDTTVVALSVFFGTLSIGRSGIDFIETPIHLGVLLEKWRMGVWSFLPVLPLLLVPIFEPYHYSVMWAPVVVLLAWTAQQWMGQWKLKGMLSVVLIGHLASEGMLSNELFV